MTDAGPATVTTQMIDRMADDALRSYYLQGAIRALAIDQYHLYRVCRRQGFIADAMLRKHFVRMLILILRNARTYPNR